jgi:AcrR family transcriptional regulator
MSEVASEAGISQGLAYRYFPSKDAIFTTLVRESIVSPEELDARILKMPGTPGIRLRSIISTMVERRQKIPEFYLFMNRALGDEKLPDGLHAAMTRQGIAARAVLRQLIVEAQTAGEIAKDDPDQLLAAIMACLEGLSRSLVSPGVNPPENGFPDARIFLRMLRPDAESG